MSDEEFPGGEGSEMVVREGECLRGLHVKILDSNDGE